MLKARVGNTFFFGLSDKNIELLKQDRPIIFDLGELGAEGRVVIFSGKDEAVMEASFKARIANAEEQAAPIPPYVEKVKALVDAAGIAPGSVVNIKVDHDATCPMLAEPQGECNCDPDVSLMETQ